MLADKSLLGFQIFYDDYQPKFVIIYQQICLSRRRHVLETIYQTLHICTSCTHIFTFRNKDSIIYYSFIIIHNHTNMQQQYLSPIIKHIRDHIEDEDGDARRVQVLNLKNCKIGTVICLTMLPNLKIADLRNNDLASMLGFQDCVHLEELHLCENRITKIQGIGHLAKLKMIDLRGNCLTDLNSTILNLPPSLTELRARCNLITHLEQICKLNNRFQVIWLDENLFVKTSKQYLKRIFSKKGWELLDFWI